MPSPTKLFLGLLLTSVVLAPTALSQTRPESFQLALGMQQRGLHDEAARYLKQFLREHRGHELAAEGCYRLAQSQIELQQIDDATRSLQQGLQAGGRAFALRAESQYRLGGLLQQQGKNEQAVQHYDRLLSEVDAKHYLLAPTHFARGEALRDQGDDQGAAKAFAAAAERASGEQQGFRFPARYQLAFALFRLEQFAAAADAFRGAREAAGDPAAKNECLYLEGDACLRARAFERAKQAFTAAAKAGGAFADDAVYGLGWVALSENDAEAALAAFARLLREHEKSPFADRARLERARCFYQADAFAEATRELAPLLRDDHPLLQAARELEGLCALASGAGKEAVQSLQRAVQSAATEDKPRLSFALGEALANLQRWDEALQAYEAVGKVADAGLRGDALYGSSHALHQLQRFDDSIRAAQAVVQIEPEHRSRKLAMLAVAENLFALGRHEQARPAYARLLDDATHRATARWKIAWCLYLAGDKQTAAARFADIAKDREDANGEEALAMNALALYESGQRDQALAAADRYAARHRDGRFLARCERIAARVLQQRGELGAAQRRLQRAASIAREQNDQSSLLDDTIEQADLAYEQGDYGAADELFAKLVQEQGPVGARARAGRAWCAFELGDDEACLQRLQAARQHPQVERELPGLFELESAVHHRLQQWPQAVAAARGFLQRFAKHEKASTLRYALGVALARSGDQRQAREVLTQLLRDGDYGEPDRARYELAWACRRGGDEAAALANFAEVAGASKDVELVGESKLFLGQAALAAEPPDLAKARGLLASVQGSHRKRALYQLGFAEFETGDEDAKQLQHARDHFAAIVAEGGEELRGEALYLGAECCRRLGDAARAMALAEQLLRELPQHERCQRARLVVGECALATDKANEAIAPLQRFLRGHEVGDDAVARADAARANLWLGRARLAQQQHEPAEACFVKVTELSDGELAAEAQFRLGQSRGQRGDWNAAADAFVKLSILYADAGWVRRGLLAAGRAYLQLNQPTKADRFFKELIEKHQGSDEAKAAAAARKTR